MDTEPIETIDDEPVEDLETVEEESPAASETGQPPFFRSWVWWCSLITALPAGFVVYELIQGAIGLSESLNIMWVVTMGTTFVCAAAAITLPVLLALGKMHGGVLIEGAAPAIAQGPSAESSVISSAQISDIDYGPDDSDDLGELFDSTDAAVSLEDDSEDDLDDFDDF